MDVWNLSGAVIGWTDVSANMSSIEGEHAFYETFYETSYDMIWFGWI